MDDRPYDRDDVRMQPRRRDETAVILDYLPRMSPKVYSGVMAWVLCIYMLLFATAPTSSPEALATHSEYMRAANNDPIARELEREMFGLMRQRDEHKVFFYSWREPYKSLVAAKQAEVDAKMPELQHANAEQERLRTKARKAVGLWSEIGVSEVRAQFWKSWTEGKDFAKRMTFWDMLLHTGKSKEETLASVLFRWLSQFLMNLSLGLIAAVFWFAGRAINLVFAYEPSFVSGFSFVAISVVGAAGSVVLFLGLCYSAAVGGVYILAKQASHARLEAQQRQQQVRGQQRPQAGRAHYE
ncbi:hypothetical protein T492DRAFT_957790 [Pavlovales sp. CCMP2436]|nr:hypothetical protein T492DRAFT_957790 [Pavlovales sp. CCMP2436]